MLLRAIAGSACVLLLSALVATTVPAHAPAGDDDLRHVVHLRRQSQSGVVLGDAAVHGTKRVLRHVVSQYGPPFSAVPFLPAQVHGVPVGTAAVSFTDGNTGAFAYVVHDGINVATQTKPITRQVFRAPGTVCQ
jgi:hypothetical protein